MGKLMILFYFILSVFLADATENRRHIHVVCRGIINSTRIMKNLLLLFVLSQLPLLASADNCGKCGDNLTYSFVDATHTLTISGTGKMTDYNGEDAYVDNIPWYRYKEDIWNVVIEDGVTGIGKYAFYECSNLKDISIPNSVTTIGQYAFSFCTSLTSVAISPSVTSLEQGVFFCCAGLTDVTIPNSVTAIGVAAFYECSSLTSISIPRSVKSIKARAFKDCFQLKKVVIEDIAAWCDISFDDNPVWYAHHIYNVEGAEIRELEIPILVKSISNRAFMFCYSLTSLTIPSFVTNVGDVAFAGCYNLTNVVIDKSKTHVGNYAFNNCFSLTGIVSLSQTVSSCPDDNHPHIMDLGLDDGTEWTCCNVGATVPEGYGDYFAWGETSPKDYYYWDSYKWYEGTDYDYDFPSWHEGDNRLTKYNYDSEYGVVDDKFELDLEDDAAYVNWGGNWRTPNGKQLAYLLNNTIWEEMTVDGVVGTRFASKKTGNYIFMPHSGWMVYRTKHDGFRYWTRMLAPKGEYSLWADCMGTFSCLYPRYYGIPVRPIVYDGGESSIQVAKSKNVNSQTYYTLDGRLVNGKPRQHGVYITNGRKIIIK